MAVLATILFAVVAVVGAVMAVQRLRGTERPPTGVALAHGGVGAVALVLYIIALATTTAPPTAGWWAVGLFVLAALGGAGLFLGYHLRGRPLSVPLVLIHGGVGVIAFVVLLVALLGGGGADTAAAGY